jgi:hypothetical protein
MITTSIVPIRIEWRPLAANSLYQPKPRDAIRLVRAVSTTRLIRVARVGFEDSAKASAHALPPAYAVARLIYGKRSCVTHGRLSRL